jgi:putative phage-type endonuclease
MLTAAEIEARRDWIGASEAAAVLGIHPQRSAYEVWAEKVGDLKPFDGNKYTDAGTRFERAVLDWAEEELGDLHRNVPARLAGLPLGSTLDALTIGGGVPVEAKTAGLLGPLPDGWGDEGTDQVPDCYLVQCQMQMLCTDAEAAFLAAFLHGRGFQMFKINRSEKICGYLKTYLPDWWDRHVVARVAPPLANTSIDILKRLRREPNKTVEIATATAERYERACKEVTAAETEKKAAQAELLIELGDAEAADFGDPSRVLTFYEQTRKAHYVKESTFRVLRFSKRS